MHRTLIIGIGGRGASWANQVKRHEQFTLTGIADVEPKMLAKWGEEFQIPPEHRHEDYNEALVAGGWDVAIIAVPHHLHYPITKDVLNASLHCLVEKPFTLELAEAKELVQLADERELILEVVQNYRFKPLCKFIENAIAEQRLGRLASVEGTFHRRRPPRSDQEANMPYPMLFIQGIHHLDWLATILPSPIVGVVSRHLRPKWSQWQNPSICHLILQCEDGVLISYRGSYESQGEISTYDGFWRFEFEQGDLIIDQNRAVWQIMEAGDKREEIFRPTGEKKSGDECLLDTLHEAINTGTEPPTSARNNLKTLKLLFEVMETQP